jgi:hypothetical protein
VTRRKGEKPPPGRGGFTAGWMRASLTQNAALSNDISLATPFR